jgi:hypothetical protein
MSCSASALVIPRFSIWDTMSSSCDI